MTSFLIQSDTHNSITELRTALNKCFDTDTLNEITIDTSTTHDDWEYGDSCPECGNAQMSTITPVEDVFHSEHGEFEFMDHGDFVGDTISVMCTECEELLVHTPYEKL